MFEIFEFSALASDDMTKRPKYRTCKNSVVARFFPVGPANVYQNSGFYSKLIKSTQLLNI